MAYEIPNIEGQVSEWNEAMFKMMRLHRIQTEINTCKMNPLSRYEDGQYNYKVWFSLLNILYFEGKSKYASTEIVEMDSLKQVIEDLMIKCPVHSSKISSGYGDRKLVDMFNQGKWVMLKRLLELYETNIKFYNDKHGLSTKNAESINGGSIIR